MNRGTHVILCDSPTPWYSKLISDPNMSDMSDMSENNQKIVINDDKKYNNMIINIVLIILILLVIKYIMNCLY